MIDYAEYLALDLDEDQRMILDMVGQLATELVAPANETIDEARSLPAEVREGLAESGLFGLRAPEIFGGVEMDWTTQLFAQAILARASASVALEAVLQSQGFLEPLAAAEAADEFSSIAESIVGGQATGAIAWAEEQASLDGSSMQCRVEDGVLSGTKTHVLGASEAAHFLVFAACDDGVEAWVLPRVSHGLTVGDSAQRLGMVGVSSARVDFDGVELSAVGALRVSAADRGAALFQATIAQLRAGMIAIGCGLALASREASLGYAIERQQFDRPIADFEAIREKLANAESAHLSAASLLVSVARRLEKNSHDEELLSFVDAARTLVSDLVMKTADDTLQVFGGYGYSEEYPAERLYRDARYLAIGFGGNDLLRIETAGRLIQKHG